MNDKAKPTIVVGERKKPQQYIAYTEAYRSDSAAYRGTLSEILEEMENDENDPAEFQFYLANEVKVKFVKKLVLEAEAE